MEGKPLKNFGMITEKDFLGKTLEEATEIAINDGYIVRVTERDGDAFILTMDIKVNRLNFRVNKNIIVGLYVG